jgi:vacuolar iron transporter family protein
MSDASLGDLLPLRRVSFGGPAAIVASVALIVGLDAAAADRAAIVGSLLILALADNLTDALGVHIYQESERLASLEAFRTTVANFLTRLFVSLSFVALVLNTPAPLRSSVSLAWGLLLLAVLSHLIARARRVNSATEIAKHCGVALIVIALSAVIGKLVPLWVA